MIIIIVWYVCTHRIYGRACSSDARSAAMDLYIRQREREREARVAR